MTSRFILKDRKTERGAAMVEFAVVLPLLFLLSMGATDFGRLFFHAVTMANASGTGAFFGAQNNIIAGNLAGMRQKAREDANDLSGVTVEATQRCECQDGTKVECTDLGNVTCAGYGKPRAYVVVEAEQTFQTIGPYPGIPRTTVVGRKTYMRVE